MKFLKLWDLSGYSTQKKFRRVCMEFSKHNWPNLVNWPNLRTDQFKAPPSPPPGKPWAYVLREWAI